jgi:hypothetical protein
MTAVYIEGRPKGYQGQPDHYVVEDRADNVLATHKTQGEAIRWAKGRGYSPIHIAHVRNTDKGNPDHWRPA